MPQHGRSHTLAMLHDVSQRPATNIVVWVWRARQSYSSLVRAAPARVRVRQLCTKPERILHDLRRAPGAPGLVPSLGAAAGSAALDTALRPIALSAAVPGCPVEFAAEIDRAGTAMDARARELRVRVARSFSEYEAEVLSQAERDVLEERAAQLEARLKDLGAIREETCNALSRALSALRGSSAADALLQRVRRECFRAELALPLLAHRSRIVSAVQASVVSPAAAAAIRRLGSACVSATAAAGQNPFVILRGEAGCGKSTQLPQYLLEDGVVAPMPGRRMLVVQPQAASCMALAARVSKEWGEEGAVARIVPALGVRDAVGSRTALVFTTADSLLHDLGQDADAARAGGEQPAMLLHDYCVVMLDEVHERSVAVDLLLVLLRSAALQRARSARPLCIVAASATAEAEQLQSFFACDDVPTPPVSVFVPGRAFPVRDVFLPLSAVERDFSDAQLASLMRGDGLTRSAAAGTDALDEGWSSGDLAHLAERSAAAAARVAVYEHLRLGHSAGVVLAFLPHDSSCEAARRYFRELWKHLLHVLSCTSPERRQQLGLRAPHTVLLTEADAGITQHAALQAIEDLGRDSSGRAVVFATSVAESSLTIPGLRVVIDSGLEQRVIFDRVRRASLGVVVPASRSSATQRRGRAGRDVPGRCVRLYTPTALRVMPDAAVPEILRTNLAHPALRLAQLGLPPHKCAWLQPPGEDALRWAWAENGLRGLITREACTLLQAEEELAGDLSSCLTPNGRLVLALPLPVEVAQLLLAGTEVYGCEVEAVEAAAVLLTQAHVSLTATATEALAEAAKLSPRGDVITTVRLLRALRALQGKAMPPALAGTPPEGLFSACDMSADRLLRALALCVPLRELLNAARGRVGTVEPAADATSAALAAVRFHCDESNRDVARITETASSAVMRTALFAEVQPLPDATEDALARALCDAFFTNACSSNGPLQAGYSRLQVRLSDPSTQHLRAAHQGVHVLHLDATSSVLHSRPRAAHPRYITCVGVQPGTRARAEGVTVVEAVWLCEHASAGRELEAAAAEHAEHALTLAVVDNVSDPVLRALCGAAGERLSYLELFLQRAAGTAVVVATDSLCATAAADSAVQLPANSMAVWAPTSGGALDRASGALRELAEQTAARQRREMRLLRLPGAPHCAVLMTPGGMVRREVLHPDTLQTVLRIVGGSSRTWPLLPGVVHAAAERAMLGARAAQPVASCEQLEFDRGLQWVGVGAEIDQRAATACPVVACEPLSSPLDAVQAFRLTLASPAGAQLAVQAAAATLAELGDDAAGCSVTCDLLPLVDNFVGTAEVEIPAGPATVLSEAGAADAAGASAGIDSTAAAATQLYTSALLQACVRAEWDVHPPLRTCMVTISGSAGHFDAASVRDAIIQQHALQLLVEGTQLGDVGEGEVQQHLLLPVRAVTVGKAGPAVALAASTASASRGLVKLLVTHVPANVSSASVIINALKRQVLRLLPRADGLGRLPGTLRFAAQLEPVAPCPPCTHVPYDVEGGGAEQMYCGLRALLRSAALLSHLLSYEAIPASSMTSEPQRTVCAAVLTFSSPLEAEAAAKLLDGRGELPGWGPLRAHAELTQRYVVPHAVVPLLRTALRERVPEARAELLFETGRASACDTEDDPSSELAGGWLHCEQMQPVAHLAVTVPTVAAMQRTHAVMMLHLSAVRPSELELVRRGRMMQSTVSEQEEAALVRHPGLRQLLQQHGRESGALGIYDAVTGTLRLYGTPVALRTACTAAARAVADMGADAMAVCLDTSATELALSAAQQSACERAGAVELAQVIVPGARPVPDMCDTRTRVAVLEADLAGGRRGMLEVQLSVSARKRAATQLSEAPKLLICAPRELLVHLHANLDAWLTRMDTEGMGGVEDCCVCYEPLQAHPSALFIDGERLHHSCAANEAASVARGEPMRLLARRPFALAELSMLLSPAQLERRAVHCVKGQALALDVARARVAASGERVTVCCLTVDCPGLWDLQRLVRFHSLDAVACPVCNLAYCLLCGARAHAGRGCRAPSAEEVRQLLRMCSEATGLPVKPCSHCWTPVHKTSGCDKIPCSACKKFFCWRCGFKGNSAGEVYTHMSANGGYFSGTCTREWW